MISKSPEETKKIAHSFAKKVVSHTDRALVVALSGNLGSGKTTFAKAFAGAFGVHEREVTSPTFVIMKSHSLDSKRFPFKKFIHVDAYRLEKGEEMEKLGWDRLLEDPGNMILIEWPENIGHVLPENAVKIFFSHIDENTREIVFN
ncbi:MAG: tRNA (adenosine(37)-N6)-threonylcarbamoyltransferase complex ATPase subunit type 1 TsaE [Patescibacteria group bacterium]